MNIYGGFESESTPGEEGETNRGSSNNQEVDSQRNLPPPVSTDKQRQAGSRLKKLISLLCAT